MNPDTPLRKASVRSLTVVNLAVLTREKFNQIVTLYPQFRQNLDLIVKKRGKAQMRVQKSPSEVRKKMLKQLQQSNDSSCEKSSNEESSCDDSINIEDRVAEVQNPIEPLQQELQPKSLD